MTNSDHMDFGNLFTDADSNFTRSAGLDDLRASCSHVLITSAIAKCLDFNKCVQETGSGTPGFFMVANLRAMCEELIYCSLFRLIGQPSSDELVKKVNHLALLRNIRAQTRLFALNNQLQPALGSFTDSTEQKAAIDQASADVNDVWKRLGLIGKNDRRPPSTWRLSREVGLETTYDYAYHLTSNFVHFNPGQLFRNGWGPMEGPFSFYVGNFEGYFSNLARFLGALLFCGYCHLASDKFEPDAANRYADTIAIRLQGNFRWPEITTYEEMNQTWPDNIIVRSLMTILREDDPKAMPDVLSELRGLAKLGPVS